MNLKLRKVAILSTVALVVVLGSVYTFGYVLAPRNSTLESTPSNYVKTPVKPSFLANIPVFAYSNEGFVNASVTITGPQWPNPLWVKEVTTMNGTTSTDLQDPLTFKVPYGRYLLVGTYSSCPPQTVTVDTSEQEVILNFGSSLPPPLGHIVLEAYYTGNESSEEYFSPPVRASVSIFGPECHNGTTIPSYNDQLIFTVAPGTYSIVGTYGSALPQKKTVEVTAGSYVYVALVFGDRSVRLAP